MLVFAGFMGLVACLEATLAQVCRGTAAGGGSEAGRHGGQVGAAGRGGAELEEPVGGGGGAADWMILRRETLSSFATLLVSVASFSTSAGPLW